MPHKHKANGKWTGMWMGQLKWEGRKIRKLFETKEQARMWEVDKRRRLESPPSKPATPSVSLIEWSTKYLEYAQRHRPKVLSEKVNVMRRLFEKDGKGHRRLDPHMPVSEVTVEMALKHLQHHRKTHSGHSTNKERKNLVAAWNWGKKHLDGFPQPNVFEAVDEFPEVRKPRYIPPERDVWAVLEVATGQDKAMFLAFLHTGARRDELHRLRWDDVDFDRQQIRLTTYKTKGGHERVDWLPMTDQLMVALLEHRRHASNEWVFVQEGGRQAGQPYGEYRAYMKRLCEEAGVRCFDRHAIRHHTGTMLAKAGVPMLIIQRVLRHQRLATTEGYLHSPELVKPHLQVLEGGLRGKGPMAGPIKKTAG